MKHNWEYKRLGDVCHVIGGSTPKTEVSEFWNGTLNWFTPAEISEKKYYASSERKITEEAVEATGLTILPPGTVLLTSRAPIGKVGIATDYCYCNQGFKNLICKDLLFNEYLYYTLIYLNDDIKDKGRGATFKEISKKVTESISIPVPPMETQEKIVAELDQINDLIAKNRELLLHLDALAQSLFYDTFGDPITNPKGWDMKKLFEECVDIIDGDHSAPPKASEGVPFITISNIDRSRNSIDFSDSFFVPQSYYDGLKSNRKARNGDVLYTVTGSYGITVLINNQPNFCFQRHIGLIRPNTTLNSVFLAHWGRSSAIKSHADKVATGIAQKTVSLTSLRECLKIRLK